MSKTELTKQLERNIFKATLKNGVWGCFEVTIGTSNEYGRVDYMTFDSKNWRFYEIKVSVSDFRSKAKKTFCGHYNYYVLTEEVYEKVKDEIPKHIGVYINGTCIKRAKKQALQVDEQVLKNSMIRSLFREARKGFEEEDPYIIPYLKKRVESLQNERNYYHRQYLEVHGIAREKYGRDWYKGAEEEAIKALSDF
jgi:hypothetical protein